MKPVDFVDACIRLGEYTIINVIPQDGSTSIILGIKSGVVKMSLVDHYDHILRLFTSSTAPIFTCDPHLQRHLNKHDGTPIRPWDDVSTWEFPRFFQNSFPVVGRPNVLRRVAKLSSRARERYDLLKRLVRLELRIADRGLLIDLDLARSYEGDKQRRIDARMMDFYGMVSKALGRDVMPVGVRDLIRANPDLSLSVAMKRYRRGHGKDGPPVAATQLKGRPMQSEGFMYEELLTTYDVMNSEHWGVMILELQDHPDLIVVAQSFSDYIKLESEAEGFLWDVLDSVGGSSYLSRASHLSMVSIGCFESHEVDATIRFLVHEDYPSCQFDQVLRDCRRVVKARPGFKLVMLTFRKAWDTVRRLSWCDCISNIVRIYEHIDANAVPAFVVLTQPKLLIMEVEESYVDAGFFDMLSGLGKVSRGSDLSEVFTS